MEIKIKKGKLRLIELSRFEIELLSSCESRVIYIPRFKDQKYYPKYFILWGNGFGNPYKLFYLKKDDDDVFRIEVDKYLDDSMIIEDLFEGVNSMDNLHLSLPFNHKENQIHDSMSLSLNL